MTTPKQQAANRRNAMRSTGPTSDAGKAVARLNATSHGLRAASPVVPGEDPAAWEEYRDAVVSDLAPVGILETELADRVALLAWRLRRVAAFEAGVVARASDRAARRARGEETDEPADTFSLFGRTRRPTHPLVEARERVEHAERAVADGERLAPLLARLSAAPDGERVGGADALFTLSELAAYLPEPDDDDDDEDGDDLDSDPMTDPTHPRFLLAVGVPSEAHVDPDEWCGWTAGAVRLGVERIARSQKWTRDRLLARAAAGVDDLGDERAELTAARRALRAAEKQAASDEAAARRRALVPAKDTADVVLRYEGHLQRQLTQTLHELERRQALRSENPPQPPAALDVTVHAPDGVTLPALEG